MSYREGETKKKKLRDIDCDDELACYLEQVPGSGLVERMHSKRRSVRVIVAHGLRARDGRETDDKESGDCEKKHDW